MYEISDFLRFSCNNNVSGPLPLSIKVKLMLNESAYGDFSGVSPLAFYTYMYTNFMLCIDINLFRNQLVVI
jgi:hypothetical protein